MPMKTGILRAAALAMLTVCPLLPQGNPAFLPTRTVDPVSWGTFLSCLETIEQWVGPSTPEWIFHSSVLSYSARKPLYDDLGRPLLDQEGRQRCLMTHQSGRVFFPPAWRARAGTRMPIVLYSHGTTLLKSAVPSDFGGHEWILGAAAAAYYGFAVAMPDQPGMGGDSTVYHPYMHAKSLAYAALDALPAVRELFSEDPFLVRNRYAWDGRVFLAGYSEGGYSAMAAAREMETHREDYGGEKAFVLAGSACMAGPFDLSGEARRQVTDPEAPFDHPFFLPHVLLGYHAVYGDVMSPLETLAPALMRTGEDGNILEWSSGLLDGLAVDEYIARRMGVPKDQVVLRSLMEPGWAARNLDDPGFQTSPMKHILEENDVAEGWTPSRPILFCQSPDDRDVPVQNTLKAMAHLGAALETEGREARDLLFFWPLGAPGCGITHVTGAFRAIPLAFDWIYRGMPPAP